MKVLVVLTAALAWSNLLNVEGNLLEKVEEAKRGFFPSPFFPPYQPTYSPGVYPPFNAPPECFPQPVVPEPQACPVCPVAESCTCEPKLNACQTYSITVCPSGPPPAAAAAPVVEEVIDEKVVEVQTGQVISAEKKEVVDVTTEFVNNPSMFGPMGGFTPYPGFNQLVGGMYPQYGGFPGQFGSNLAPQVSAVRSLGDDNEEGGDNSNTPKKK